MGYAEFARLLARCELVITDSGGIQEEARRSASPCSSMRETSERVEGIEAGTLALVGTDPEQIVTAAAPAARRRRGVRGDGAAPRTRTATATPAERIVAALVHLRFGGAPPAAFGAGTTAFSVLRAAGARNRSSCRSSSGRTIEVAHPLDELRRSVMIPFDGVPVAVSDTHDHRLRRDHRDDRSGRVVLLGARQAGGGALAGAPAWRGEDALHSGSSSCPR